MSKPDLRQILSINAPALYRAALLLLVGQPGVEIDARGEIKRCGDVNLETAELLAVIQGIQAEMFR